MLAAERRSLLLAKLHQDGKLVARDLAIELGLSEDSLRRDLRELAAAGLCQRVSAERSRFRQRPASSPRGSGSRPRASAGSRCAPRS
jgi:DeoR/GlpR family transcriptional regulator of sugar metabolism